MKCSEIVSFRVDIAYWIVLPYGLRIGVWSSYV
jgi:hypothetical protein